MRLTSVIACAALAWTAGAATPEELVACPVSQNLRGHEVVLQAKPAKGHLQDVCFDGKGSVYWAHTREIYKTDLSGRVLAKAGIEVIKRVGSDFFLNCYDTGADGQPLPFDTIRIDANFRETGRGKLGGATGLVFDGESVWTGWTRFDKATKTYTSKIVRKPRPDWML